MSTNCNIRIIRENGTRTGIYCHSDGYIEYTGMILQLFYNTAEKVEELLKQGDLSHLAPNLEDTIAYHRDRGEKFRQTYQDEEYNYTFLERKGVWIVTFNESWEWYENDMLDVQMMYSQIRQEDLLINAIKETLADSFGFFQNYCQKYIKTEVIDEYELLKLANTKALLGRNQAIIRA